MESARFIKSKHPHDIVEVKDLQSGDVMPVVLRPAERCPLSPLDRTTGFDRSRNLHKRIRLSTAHPTQCPAEPRGCGEAPT
jgi:hypothetical protein